MQSPERNVLIESLSSLTAELRNKCKVQSISVFGSIVRGEATPDSDIDILVDFKEGADLLDLMAVGNILEERLGRKVDVVSRNGLRKELKDRIEKEAVAI